MYHNKVYFADDRSDEDIFSPAVVSAFKILTDENYYHRTDDEERTYHPKETLSFIRCVAGGGKIFTDRGEFDISENEYIILPFSHITKYKSTCRVFGYRWTNFLSHGKICLLSTLYFTAPSQTRKKKHLTNSFCSAIITVIRAMPIFCSPTTIIELPQRLKLTRC